jgi:hypothetical protein
MAEQKALKVGDRADLQHGPFRAVWEVIEVGDHGAVFSYVGPVRYVGFEHPSTAPDGTQLTHTPRDCWVGRAHWGGVDLIE